MTSDFTKGLEFILKWEGGWAGDMKDIGRSRMRGITQNEYDRYRYGEQKSKQTVKLISQEELDDIYYHSYWVPGQCETLPYPLNIVHFDTIVNDGMSVAEEYLTTALEETDDVDQPLFYIELRKAVYWDKFSDKALGDIALRAHIRRCNDLATLCKGELRDDEE